MPPARKTYRKARCEACGGVDSIEGLWKPGTALLVHPPHAYILPQPQTLPYGMKDAVPSETIFTSEPHAGASQ